MSDLLWLLALAGALSGFANLSGAYADLHRSSPEQFVGPARLVSCAVLLMISVASIVTSWALGYRPSLFSMVMWALVIMTATIGVLRLNRARQAHNRTQ